MNLEIFENMEAPDLRKYIKFLLWHYRLVDAFWLLNVAERYDQSVAEHNLSPFLPLSSSKNKARDG